MKSKMKLNEKYEQLIEGQEVQLSYDEWRILSFKVDDELDDLELVQTREGDMKGSYFQLVNA